MKHFNHVDEYMIYDPPQNKSNQAVLFLHGGPGESSADFLYLSQLKTRNYHFFYYDQRGTGKTQLKNKNKSSEINIETLAQDLHETVDYIKTNYPIEQVILSGHSVDMDQPQAFNQAVHDIVSDVLKV